MQMNTKKAIGSKKITQILAATALLALFAAGEASAQILIVAVQNNGNVRYYNPQTNAGGYVNNSASYSGGETVISSFATGSDFYALSKKTTGGAYVVSNTSFSSISISAAGSLSLGFTGSLITNATSDTLVDFARVGTDFYFLGSTGKVYLNSSTTALYDLGTTLAGTYSSLAITGGQLYAGAYTSANADYKVSVSASPVSTQISSNGGTGSGLELAGNSSSLYFVRQDGLAYQNTESTPNYRGNINRVVEAGVGINANTGIDMLYGITTAGVVRYGQADTQTSTSSFSMPTDSTYAAMSVVTVIPEPSTMGLGLAGLLGIAMRIRYIRRTNRPGKI